MLRGFTLSLTAYGLSAGLFLLFSIFFVRGYGPETYGKFSILLNTVSALTLFGNYHGALVPFSVATERRAFFRFLRPLSLYAICTAAIAGVALAVIAGLDPPLGILAGVAFALIVLCGLPTAALLASPLNWLVNAARAMYQVILILAFWLLFELGHDLSVAFVMGLLFAAAFYLCMLGMRVRFPAAPHRADRPPSGILIFSLGWNLAVMGIMVLDKVVIRFLNVGPSSADVGLYLLHFDIAGRFCALYAIALAPFTYEVLQRRRKRISLMPPISLAVAASLCIGIAGCLVGYFVLPPLYGIQLGQDSWLPAVIGCYLVLAGLSSTLLAYCNATGRTRFLLWHYLSILVVASGAVLAFYIAEGRLTVVQLALALAGGYAVTLISALCLAHSERTESQPPELANGNEPEAVVTPRP